MTSLVVVITFPTRSCVPLIRKRNLEANFLFKTAYICNKFYFVDNTFPNFAIKDFYTNYMPYQTYKEY